jgi:pantothenate kinase
MSPDAHSNIVDIDALASGILALPDQHGIVAVAIAGAPGSGKSTLAETLCGRLGARSCVIPMDGFHLDNATLSARGLLSVKGAPETFDLPGFTRLVDGVKGGATRQFPTFDRDIDSVVECGGAVPDGVSILLFEGNYLLFDEDGWRDLAHRWDASVWLDVPEEVLEHRLTQRWLDQGLSPQDALARAMGNDIVNAHRVVRRAMSSTWTVRN